MPEEKTICNVCGKEVDLTMSFSVTGGEPTPPICKKCFTKGTELKLKQLKEDQKMPRGLTAVKDIEKATAPKEETEYWRADQVREIATKLIKENEVKFGHLLNFKIAYVFKDKLGSDVAGKAQVLSPLNLFLSGYDAAIIISNEKFEGLKPIQQEALVAHELSFLGISENEEKLMTQKEDCNEFIWVMKKYGAWNESLEKVSQLDLFDNK